MSTQISEARKFASALAAPFGFIGFLMTPHPLALIPLSIGVALLGVVAVLLSVGKRWITHRDADALRLVLSGLTLIGVWIAASESRWWPLGVAVGSFLFGGLIALWFAQRKGWVL